MVVVLLKEKKINTVRFLAVSWAPEPGGARSTQKKNQSWATIKCRFTSSLSQFCSRRLIYGTHVDHRHRRIDHCWNRRRLAGPSWNKELHRTVHLSCIHIINMDRWTSSRVRNKQTPRLVDDVWSTNPREPEIKSIDWYSVVPLLP